ncbi:hypothetical protein [Campylobacter jejuni]|uniref:hypothetical protein n=1 Tax=Campylobacter jejuni TaxID=197 RepID=UPI00313A8F43
MKKIIINGLDGKIEFDLNCFIDKIICIGITALEYNTALFNSNEVRLGKFKIIYKVYKKYDFDNISCCVMISGLIMKQEKKEYYADINKEIELFKFNNLDIIKFEDFIEEIEITEIEKIKYKTYENLISEKIKSNKNDIELIFNEICELINEFSEDYLINKASSILNNNYIYKESKWNLL